MGPESCVWPEIQASAADLSIPVSALYPFPLCTWAKHAPVNRRQSCASFLFLLPVATPYIAGNS